MFKILEGSGDGILGVELSSGYTKEDFDEFKDAFEREIAGGSDRISILCRIDSLSLGKTSPAAFVDDCRYALGHIKQLRHIAIVGQSNLVEFLVKADNCLLGSPGDDRIEKYFDVADLDQAWEFVRS